jgi:hypothetical protein
MLRRIARFAIVLVLMFGIVNSVTVHQSEDFGDEPDIDVNVD